MSLAFTDAPERSGGDAGRGPDMNVVDFPPGMRHTGRFRYATVFVQGVVATVCVRLQDTAVPGKVLLRVNTLGASPAQKMAGVLIEGMDLQLLELYRRAALMRKHLN